MDYLEFGVSGGLSFKWWVDKCANNKNKFYRFDTFEGLPENWGTFKKGDMSANIPTIDDTSVKFVKGLFEDTIPTFFSTHNI